MRRLRFCFFKQKTAYEMRISDWSSDVCSSDLAIFIANYGNAAVRAANAASQGELADPPDELAETSLLSPRGELLIATAKEEARFEQHMAGATETEEIGPDEAVRLFPILPRERLPRACYDNPARQDKRRVG